MTDTVIILVCEKVFRGMITAIEGNRGEKVDRRVIPLGWGYIRGYVAPRYEKAVTGTGENPGTGKKSVETVRTERRDFRMRNLCLVIATAFIKMYNILYYQYRTEKKYEIMGIRNTN